MENKLIPLSDFVLKTVHTPNVSEAIFWEQTEERLQKIYKYTHFLKQTLALWMFVPCDENNVPLEFIEYEAWTGSDEEYNKHTHKYFEAKERVLFEVDNYEDVEDSVLLNNIDFIVSKNTGKLFYGNFTAKTIEDLTRLENRTFTLTETAIKQIYGS